MIRRLKLKSFGRFQDRTFEFGGLTLFRGPNEAGKSTVFDALAKSLCVFRGPQAFLERYGKEAEAKAEFLDGREMKFDSTEYFGFFAVKSDSISVPFEGDARWMDRVKNSLFSGGVNPQVLAAELEKALGAAGRKKAERERAASLARAEARIASLKAELAAADGAKEAARQLKRRLDEAGARVAALEKERRGLSAAREEQEARDRFRFCASVLKDREKLSSLAALRTVADESAECRAMRTGAEEARVRLESESAALEALRKALAEARARRQEAEEDAAKREREARAASGICRGLEEASVLRETRRRLPGPASFLSLAFVVLGGIACGALFLAFGAPLWSFALAAAAGAAAGAASFLLLRKTVIERDDGPARRALEGARSDWRRLLPGAGELPGADAVSALSFLRSVIDLGARAGERAEEARAAFAKAEAEAAAGTERSEQNRRAAESLGAALSAWLSARGASSYEEYLALVSESAARRARIAELAAGLDERARESGAEDSDDLAARAKDELEKLRARWPEAGDAAARTQAAPSAGLKRVDAELDRAKETEKALLAEYSTALALAERDAAALLEELSREERAAQTLSEAIARDRVLRDSESAAREVFLAMSSSGALAFASLSRKVSSFYGSLGAGERGLELASLDLASAMVPDGYGKPRPPRHLSLGTRDIFVLSCRLALAESQRPRDGLLALDEPFKNLDGRRARAALALLKEFRERNGYQIVLFTKDEAAERDCRDVFPSAELAIYDLGGEKE